MRLNAHRRNRTRIPVLRRRHRQEVSIASAPESASSQEDSAEPEEKQVQITYPLCPETETLSLYYTAANFMGPLSSVSISWEDFDCFQAVEALTNVHIDFEAVSFERQSSLAADITTYADTCIPKFIMGDVDIDAEWDTCIETLKSMGIEECIALEQAAYDTYIG